MNVAFRAECASNYESCGWRVGFLVGLPMWYTIVRVGVQKPNRFDKGLTLSLCQKKDALSCHTLNRFHLAASVSTVRVDDAQAAQPVISFVTKQLYRNVYILDLII